QQGGPAGGVGASRDHRRARGRRRRHSREREDRRRRRAVVPGTRATFARLKSVMSELPARVSDWLLHLVTAPPAVAHVVIDGQQRIASTGGDLGNYGLTGLVDREHASVQLPFLEGLLPLPETPFLIPSMEMPNGRVADVHLLAEADATWLVLLD